MPTKFDFVSPGIELREVDQSVLQPIPPEDGLLLIGTSRKGPAMKPVKFNDYQSFEEIFGAPMNGKAGGDPWRDGQYGAASHAVYAADAYLNSGVGKPLTFIRLGGLNKDNSNKAGWEVTQGSGVVTAAADYSGAIGLFVSGDGATATGSLAAIFYVDEMIIGMSGSTPDGTVVSCAPETFVSASSKTFTLCLSGAAGSENVTFDFTTQGTGIRSQFNTNASLLADGTTIHNGKNYKYFLGESFEGAISSLTSAGNYYAWTCRLGAASHADFKNELVSAKSGWFLGKKPNNKKLFRLEALEQGEAFQREYYASIENIILPNPISNPDATFTVSIWKIGESSPVEQFICNLNPFSENFIGKKIGDTTQEWNDETGRMEISGDYPNISSYVRVEIGENINGSDYPVGYNGPDLLDSFTISGSQGVGALGFINGGEQKLGSQTAQLISGSAVLAYTASIAYPTHQLSVENSYKNGKNYPATALHGLSRNSVIGQDDIGDYGTWKTILNGMHLAYGDALSGASYVFTLEDLKTGSAGKWYFEEGSYDAGTSYSKLNGGVTELILSGVTNFAAPFFGGFNGNNILYKNPYNSTRLAQNAYESHTVSEAIEMVSSKDLANFELISMPGVTNNDLNEELIDTVETRGDALAIVDLVGIYESKTDNGTAEQTQNLNTVVDTINSNGYDSSYAATYYPNVIINDTVAVTVPPSVAGIYAIATSEASSQPWFAPAGFNRGGVSSFKGARANEILNKSDRDTLFLANVNPIARFPATGDTVIFGQKTLQQTASALDRINVRRLMIYLKKEIGVIADTILFDQNVKATWDRFKSQAEPILSEVRSQFGITEYKLVLDETTTTPDLIDRNIMYAKIFVKPARAIEFIAIDFVITQSGVEF
jgi:hypothetical protein